MTDEELAKKIRAMVSELEQLFVEAESRGWNCAFALGSWKTNRPLEVFISKVTRL